MQFHQIIPNPSAAIRKYKKGHLTNVSKIDEYLSGKGK